MDIKNPNQKFNDSLDEALHGRSFDESELLDEDRDLIRLAAKIKDSSPEAAPADNFTINLRKRLLNEYEHLLRNSKSEKVTKPMLKRGRAGLLPRPRRRWAWVAAPIAAVALLAVFSSIAMASPGFYDKYVPQPVKNMLESAEVVKTGHLKVSSSPEGATIYLNSRDYGLAPVEINDVRVGKHNLQAQLEGYQSTEETIEVAANETTEITISLPAEIITTEEVSGSGQEDLVIEESNEQLVFLSQTNQESALGFAVAGEENTNELASFTSPISKVTASANGTVFYVYETENNYAIASLNPAGQQQIIVSLETAIRGDLQVSPNGKYLAYLIGNSDTRQIHIVDVSSGSDDVLAELPLSGDQVVNIVGLSNEDVFYVQYEDSSFIIDNFSAQAVVGGEARQVKLSDDADGETLLMSPDYQKVFYKTQTGTFSVYDITSSVISDFQITPLGSVSFVGNDKLAMGVKDKGVVLINLADRSEKTVYDKMPNDLIGDTDGRELGILPEENSILFYQTESNVLQTVTTSVSPVDLVSWIPEGTWSAGDRLYAPDSTEPGAPENLQFLSQLELSPADYEDLVVTENYAYRISNGDKSLEVISLMDAKNPEIIASLPAAGFDREIQADISGTKIIAAGGPLVVFDVSDPSQPRQVSAVGSGNTQVVLVQNTAFVGADNNLISYDVTSSPVLLGEIELPVEIYDLDYKDGNVYVAGGDGGYVVVNVADPEHMEIVSNSSSKFISEVTLAGNFSYALAGAPGGAGEFEVYNPESNELVQTISPAPASGEFEIIGSKLYAHYPKVAVYEISDNGEVIPLKEASENAIIEATGDMGITDSKVVVLSQNTLFVFNNK